jgi:hypothetical protein
MRERDGNVRAEVIPDVSKTATSPVSVRPSNPARPSTQTHGAPTAGLGADDYAHEVIDHAEEYVDGRVHTNGIENFWSVLKRGLHGTYVSVEPFHLFRYLDERVFTFKERDLTDLGRFSALLGSIADRWLTYAALTADS